MSVVVNILGTQYKLIVQTAKENPKLQDSAGLCEWLSKKIIIDTSYRDEPNALENIDEYIHKVMRHEAFHALFAEMGMRSWMDDEDLIDALAMQYPKIKEIMDYLDDLDIPIVEHFGKEGEKVTNERERNA